MAVTRTKDEGASAPLKKTQSGPARIEVDIVGPLTFWIMMLVLGLILVLVLVPVSVSLGAGQIAGAMEAVAGYIIYLPGALVLPLIVSIWIGERVGSAGAKPAAAASAGLVNASYSALVYVIAIFVVYLLLKYIAPMFLAIMTLDSFVSYVVIVPVVMVILLIPAMAALSAARRSGPI